MTAPDNLADGLAPHGDAFDATVHRLVTEAGDLLTAIGQRFDHPAGQHPAQDSLALAAAEARTVAAHVCSACANLLQARTLEVVLGHDRLAGDAGADALGGLLDRLLRHR